MESTGSTLRPALWDRLIAPYPTLPLADDTSDESERQRCARRTADFEAAIARAQPPDRATQAPASLIAEYEARLRAWAVLRRSFLADEDFGRARRSLWRGGRSVSDSAIVLLPLYATWFFIRRVLGWGTMSALHRAVVTRSCPDCQYNLSGQRSGLRINAILLPSRCPECGASWPLLPPPVRGA